MSRADDRKQRRGKVKRRYRGAVRGNADRPRLAVFRSLRHLYAQVIDDARGVTIASASTLDKETVGGIASTAGTEAAKRLGQVIATRAKEKGITTVVFDRGGFKYHGVVRAIADGAREAGLEI